MREQQCRQALAEYGRKLVRSGLVQGTWGNLSMRFDDKTMLVTPSGLDYMRLEPSDMVKVDLVSLRYEGPRKPTSEKGIHAGIYQRRADVGAVIHTHSRYCSIFAAARRDVPAEEESFRRVFGTQVNLATYAPPGTDELCRHTLAALGDRCGCVMAGHGMLCTGRTIEEAFENCLLLEACCRRYIERRMEG